MEFVVDYSQSLARILSVEASGWTNQLNVSPMEPKAIVPPSWPFEVINALTGAARRDHADSDQLVNIWANIKTLLIPALNRMLSTAARSSKVESTKPFNPEAAPDWKSPTGRPAN